MFNPKLSLTLLTVLLGLAVLALPRTELDPEKAKRRRVALRVLPLLDEQIRLSQILIEQGACDPNTAFYVGQVRLNRCNIHRDLFGATVELVRELEETFHWIYRLQCRSKFWELPQASQVPAEGQLWRVATDLEAVRTELRMPPGDESILLKRFAAMIEAHRQAQAAESSTLAHPTLPIDQQHVGYVER